MIIDDSGFDKKLVKFLGRSPEPLTTNLAPLTTCIGRTYHLNTNKNECMVDMSKHIKGFMEKYKLNNDKSIRTPCPSLNTWLIKPSNFSKDSTFRNSKSKYRSEKRYLHI